jgi:hypothetical protein
LLLLDCSFLLALFEFLNSLIFRLCRDVAAADLEIGEMLVLEYRGAFAVQYERADLVKFITFHTYRPALAAISRWRFDSTTGLASTGGAVNSRIFVATSDEWTSELFPLIFFAIPAIAASISTNLMLDAAFPRGLFAKTSLAWSRFQLRAFGWNVWLVFSLETL